MIDRFRFYEKFRPRFHSKVSQEQVDGYEAIFDYYDLFRLRNIKWLAYILATAYHETGGRMQPVREGFAQTDQQAREIVTRMFERGRISTNYSIPNIHGNSYYGRGLVQITWEDNYRRVGFAIGLGDNLWKNPDLALDRMISVRILCIGMEKGLFTGKSLSDYINDDECDYRNARRIINGLDKAHMISVYAQKFEQCIEIGGTK